MIKRETRFGLLFRHWLRKNPRFCAAFELKQTQTDSIPFSAIEDHQITALLAVETMQGILYKAPDDSRSIKPFDFFYLSDADGFVVIRYPKFFCLIDIDDFCEEKQKSKRKSLTSKRAREIAIEVVGLK